MAEDFVEIARRIGTNPLGRLMYGQRELFHSNLLAWVFDVLPAVADAAFQTFTQPGAGNERRVDRERGHLDLVMNWPGHAPLAIENKVFSIPSREQLTAYEKATAKWPEKPILLLLSMSQAGFNTGRWKELNYATLATSFEGALPDCSSYEVETVRKYIDLIRDLDILVNGTDIKSDGEPVWIDEARLRELGSSQMGAALQKARAQRVAIKIDRRLNDRAYPVDCGMSRATPMVQQLVPVRVDGRRVSLGWQLQGNQFRRAVVFRDSGLQGGSAIKRTKREDLSRQFSNLFEFPPGLPQEHAGKKVFNHFAPDFVYQYVKVPGLTVSELGAAADWVRNQIEAVRDSESPS
ncbi:PD-(D/E)XK nuclease family protein [Gordonia crocea]|uniref:PD-(D/E)XK nuclease family protein n=1 Tax=Gordonia crocea TaxID=589162 RepID=UPI00137A4FA1|nr:PD-(D/E)XK nuclease family protein [Gordonia crocea]